MTLNDTFQCPVCNDICKLMFANSFVSPTPSDDDLLHIKIGPLIVKSGLKSYVAAPSFDYSNFANSVDLHKLNYLYLNISKCNNCGNITFFDNETLQAKIIDINNKKVDELARRRKNIRKRFLKRF